MAQIVELENGKVKLIASKMVNGKQKKYTITKTPEKTSPVARAKEIELMASQFDADVESGVFKSKKELKAEAEAKAKEAEAVLTFGKYVETEVKRKRRFFKCDDKSWLSYLYSIDTWGMPEWKDIPIREISGKNITDLVLKMEEGGLSGNTVRRQLVGINAVFRLAFMEEIIDANPIDRVRKFLPKAVKVNTSNTFDEEQTRRFLEYMKKPYVTEYKSFIRNNPNHPKEEKVKGHTDVRTVPTQIQAVLTLAIVTGLRRGELIGLQWNDCNLDDDIPTISVNKSASVTEDGQIIKDPKTETSNRIVEIPHFMATMLQELKEEQMNYADKIGSYWVGKRGSHFNDNFCFIKDNGAMMDVSTPLKAFHSIVKRYNAECENEEDKLPLIRLHDLRHSHATQLIHEGTSLIDLSQRLGHADVGITSRVYIHGENKRNTATVTTIEKMFG
ncbi:MAG: site-specific integrase [Eubacteriales bacterium]|nr:site-specific integrase [Eubacteriales bacterium]